MAENTVKVDISLHVNHCLLTVSHRHDSINT